MVEPRGAAPARRRPGRGRRIRTWACPVTVLVALALAVPAAPPWTAVAPGTVNLADSTQDASPARPNIVLVLTDDLTGDLVRFMPHVRAMFRQGTSFTNYLVPEALCCPSRASLLTGRYPKSTGVVTNTPPGGGYPVFRDGGEEARTFATSLQAAGYRTALAGKYLNGYAVGPTAMSPVPPGWSEWFVSGSGSHRQYDYHVNHDRVLRTYGNAPEDYHTDVLAGFATDFITRASGGPAPFFLAVSPFTPHPPAVPAPRHADDFPDLQAPRGPAFNQRVVKASPWLARRTALNEGQIAEIDAEYRRRAQTAESLDDVVATIQRTLAATGEDRDTYVVFTSDNGYHMGEHRLPAGKETLLETDTKVPLVITGPAVGAGVRVRALASGVDLAPTFLAMAGMRPPTRVEGRSLLPWVRGQRPLTWRRTVLLQTGATSTAPADWGVRTRDALWVANADGSKEYYDLRADPDQLVNAIGALDAQGRAGFVRRLAALRGCHGDRCRVADRL